MPIRSTHGRTGRPKAKTLLEPLIPTHSQLWKPLIDEIDKRFGLSTFDLSNMTIDEVNERLREHREQIVRTVTRELVTDGVYERMTQEEKQAHLMSILKAQERDEVE